MKKEEAADLLNVSIRTLERLTQNGTISARYVKGKTRPTPDYDEEELRRVKPTIESKMFPHRGQVMMPNVAGSANVANNGEIHGDGAGPANSDTALARLAEMPAGVERLVTLMKALRDSERPSVSIEGKLLLKLDEASALTGLSRATLRAAIEAGKLKAKIVGRAWRVKRTDLETYINKL
jgi:excisionase family DNA binding protein